MYARVYIHMYRDRVREINEIITLVNLVCGRRTGYSSILSRGMGGDPLNHVVGAPPDPVPAHVSLARFLLALRSLLFIFSPPPSTSRRYAAVSSPRVVCSLPSRHTTQLTANNRSRRLMTTTRAD